VPAEWLFKRTLDMKHYLSIFGLGFGLISCGPAHAFDASFSWAGIPRCSTLSPAFTIRGAPAGTAKLRFLMTDNDAPDFPHGGSTVVYDGRGRVPQGAISYTGPCPPGVTHKYVWTVEALDASGKVLGATRASGLFPPK
jgi:hypothetical protein